MVCVKLLLSSGCKLIVALNQEHVLKNNLNKEQTRTENKNKYRCYMMKIHASTA
jgi:hypothetical protein